MSDQDDIAVLVRVRNRLAQTPDIKLSSVLTNLLPRLFQRLDGLNDNTNKTHLEQTLRMQQEILGIVSHVRTRLQKYDSDMMIGSKECCPYWLKMFIIDLCNWKSSIAITAALSLIEKAIVLADQDIASHTIPFLIIFIDRLSHDDIELSETKRTHLKMASWLLLDAISCCYGMPVVSDWDLFNDGTLISWEVLEDSSYQPQSEAIDAAKKHTSGILNLFLDVLFFWPANQNTDAAHTGISTEGWQRIHYRCKGASWNDIYLRQLKYICLRYALGCNQQPGVFSGDESAMLISILAATCHSAHGRLASDYLNNTIISKRMEKETFSDKNEGSGWVSVNGTSSSIALAVSLLMLMSGEADSTTTVDAYKGSNHKIDLLSMLRSPTKNFQRPPIPPEFVARATSFLQGHFRPNFKALDRPGMKVFLDLIVLLQEPSRHGAYFGIDFMERLYKECKSASVDEENFVRDLHRHCLQSCKLVLTSVPEARERTLEQNMEPDQIVPAGVPRRFGLRRDLDTLLSNHRTTLKRQRLQHTCALQARTKAYQMISALADENTINEISSCEKKLSFDLPNLLFQCATAENETLQPFLSGAMDSLLDTYKDIITKWKESTLDDSSETEFIVAPLLPALLNATCAQSSVARLICAQWCSGLLYKMDNAASSHVCDFLSDDPDPKVSSCAKAVLARGTKVPNDHIDRPHHIFFIDPDSCQDQIFLTHELGKRIRKVCDGLQVDENVASVLLYDEEFSPEKTIAAFKCEDRTGLLKSIGLDQRPKDVRKIDDQIVTCEICFEENTSGFSLPCSHNFCLECWENYIGNLFDESRRAIMNATCPRHDCFQRLTPSDINCICPDLFQNWKDAFMSSFVDHSNLYQRCPGDGCGKIAVREILNEPNRCIPISCQSCSTEFCFSCGSAPHQPANCADSKEWNRIFMSSRFWIMKNSKPCPSCSVPIEKNDGCNHMTCSQCGADFCWLCLGLLQIHLQAHTCNQYNPTSIAEDDDERRALFFTDRFRSHEDAETFAKNLLARVKDGALDVPFFVSEENFETLAYAIERLVEARHFLKWTYVAAWALRSKPTQLDRFSKRQATLELVTERLNQMIRQNLEKEYQSGGLRGIHMHFRAIKFLSCSVTRYKQRMHAGC